MRDRARLTRRAVRGALEVVDKRLTRRADAEAWRHDTSVQHLEPTGPFGIPGVTYTHIPVRQTRVHFQQSPGLSSSGASWPPLPQPQPAARASTSSRAGCALESRGRPRA